MAIAVAVKTTSSVGISVDALVAVVTGISVGAGDSVGALVGGIDVAVGVTACVATITVDTMVVAVADEPHALTTTAIAKSRGNVFFNFICLAIGVTAALGNNYVISHDDLPRHSLDIGECPKYFKVLFPIYECGCTIVASGSGKAVTVNM